MQQDNERHVVGPSDMPEGATGYMMYVDGKPHGPFKPGKERVRFAEPSSQYAKMGRCLEPECKACNGEPSQLWVDTTRPLDSPTIPAKEDT